MKKILFYLVACLSIILSACETESDEWKDQSYTSASVTFLNISRQDFRIEFNGKEVEMLAGITVPFSNLTGELKIYTKENNTLELDTTITIVPNQDIQLIRLLDQSLAIYDENAFSWFIVNIPYMYDTGNTYRFFYNDQEVTVDEFEHPKTYIPVSELTGTLQVYKNDETNPVLNQEITIDPEQTINLVQLPGEEIRVDLSDEEDPANRNSIKFRFLHNTRTGFFGIDLDSIRVDVFATAYSNQYNYNQYDSIGSVVAKFNIFSPYVELDMATYYEEANPTNPIVIVGYKLYNAYTGEPVMQTTSYNGKNYAIWRELVEPDDRGPRGKYKFLTYKFQKIMANYNTVFVYGTEWDTTE